MSAVLTLLIMLGVYYWANGDRQRVTFDQNELIFDNRVIYSDDDFRLEYFGDV